MGKKVINRGISANDGSGDNLRAGALKINENFDEIYTALGDGSTLLTGTYVTTSASQVLANKTISGATNTITNIPSSALSTLPNSKLDNSSITIGDDTSTNFSVDLGGSFEIVGGSGINTAITNNRIELSTDGSIVTESSTDTLTNKTISGATNTFNQIPNSALDNSSISIGGVSLALGGTDATPALNLSDATSYPTTALVGTIENAQLTGSITNDKLVNSKIIIGDNTSTNFEVNLGESFEIVGNSPISTAIDNNRIELSLGSIPNSTLANSSITLGTDAISLGGSTTSIAGLSLTGSGTVDLTGAGSKLRFDFAGYGSLPAFGTYPGMFAFDTVGNRPYYSSGSGWVRILDENASISAHTDVNTTGIADGYILEFSSAQGRFNAVANTSGSALTVADEGSDLSTAATKLDFVGAGVTASGTGSTKTITIGGSALTIQEDGSSLSTAAETLNFVGSNITATGSGATKTITVSGVPSSINDLSDVTVASLLKGQTLVYTGANFVQSNTPVSMFTVTAPDSSRYQFDGAGFPEGTSGDNPTIFLKKGQTYYFRNTSGGHPFRIQSTTGTSGTVYNDGVTDNNASGPNGVVVFHVPMDAPGTLYYQCSSHGAMQGTITIT